MKIFGKRYFFLGRVDYKNKKKNIQKVKSTGIMKRSLGEVIAAEPRREKKKSRGISVAEVTFVLPEVQPGIRRIIIAGLDPPANSHPHQQHDNHTSKLLIAELGHNLFDWIDCCKRAAVGTTLNGAFDRKSYYQELLQDPMELTRYRLELEGRVKDHLDVGNLLPLMAAAGVVVNIAIVTFSSWHLADCGYGVMLVTTPDLPHPFLLMTGYDHPTAAVQSGGDETMRKRHHDLVNMLITLHDPGARTYPGGGQSPHR